MSAESATPREMLESFVMTQIDARKERLATLDMDESTTRQRIVALGVEREELHRQIDDWMRWMGLLK